MPYKDPARQREYMRNWIHQRRIEWFNANGPCVDCGSWEHLELDHVDASEKVSHRIWSWSQERREAELVKCVIRCFPCHREKTIRNNEVAPYVPRGENHYGARFTADQIQEIRTSSLRTTDLAKQFGVYTATISKIRKGQRWKSLPL